MSYHIRLLLKGLSWHIRQRETVVVRMLDPFVGHLRSVKLGEATVGSPSITLKSSTVTILILSFGEMFVNHILSIPLQLTVKPCSPERRTVDSHHDHLVEQMENWKLDEASVRFSRDSLHARIQSCSWALVDHMSPLPPFLSGSSVWAG